MARRKSTEKRTLTPKLLEGRLMLRVFEWAELTGTPLATAYRYATTGKLPVIRIGGTLRVPVAAIIDQLKVPDVAMAD
jgi:hypothetical protein